MITSLIKELQKIKDFRSPSGQRYPLYFILIIVIVGMSQGHSGYRALANFAKANRQYLTKYFSVLRPSVPSCSTIRRAMMNIDPEQVITVFNNWASSVAQIQNQTNGDELEWIGIDGKSLVSTLTDTFKNKQNFVSIVSGFSQDTKMVVALSKFENKKQSEIHTTQSLIGTGRIKNKVFTLDALHCQKETIRIITEQGNQYLITVKSNQSKLLGCLKQHTETNLPLSIYDSEDRSHGRTVKREIKVFTIPNNIPPGWTNAQSFVQVTRSGIRKSKPFHHTTYYITSVSKDAEYLSAKIQGRWHIENQLHWVKDVVFKEDNSPILNPQTMTNFAVFFTFALNLLRFLGFVSVTEGQRWLGGRASRLLHLLE